MKPRLCDYPVPPRRSQRNRKPPKYWNCSTTAEDKTKQRHRDILLTQTYNWLDDTFCLPKRTCDEKFVAYYDMYVRNTTRLEKLCFSCKEPLDWTTSFICSSMSCVKMYHRHCLPPNYIGHLCPLHFCADCKSRVKTGRFCFMCPTTYCASCSMKKQKGEKHMSLCDFCVKQCFDGDLFHLMRDCLSCKTIATP